MYGNFTRATLPDDISGNEISWSTNPTYQSPELSGTPWYDQATHWEPNSEGIESNLNDLSSNFEPYWASRATSNSYSWTRGPEALWNATPKNDTIGLGANTAEAEEESIATNSEGLSSELSGASEVLSGLETGAEAVETGAEVAEGFSGLGIGAIINQQLGMATTNAITANLRETQNTDFIQNATQQGIGAELQANLIKGTEGANIENISAISGIGSILGPVGSLAGAAIGQSIYQPNSAYLNTANSFGGMINPQDTGIVQSLNTDQATGDTQQVDNV